MTLRHGCSRLAGGLVLTAAVGVLLAMAGGVASASAAPEHAYVTNLFSDSVTPIDLETNEAETAIGVGAGPDAIAITPNGKYAYVTNAEGNSVTPIDLETNTPETAIEVGAQPDAIAITPNGKHAYVTNEGISNSVTPIDLETNEAETAIEVGVEPKGIAITPNGKYAYVTNAGSDSVTPIDLETNEAETAIELGAQPDAIAITPNGKYAYVTNYLSDLVTPIDLEANTPETDIKVGGNPDAIAITTNGKYAYVTNRTSDSVTPIDLETNTPETNIGAGPGPQGIAITPNGKYAYVTNFLGANSSFVTPIDLETSETETSIKVGADPVGIAIAPVVEPGFTIAKQQRLEGEASYTTAELQDSSETTVEYEVVVKNTGNIYLNFSKLSDSGCEDISPGGEVELAPGGEQSYTCKRQHFPHAGKWANTASITGNEGTGEKTSNEVVVNVPAPSCTIIEGSGFYKHNGQRLVSVRNTLSTTLTDPQHLRVQTQNGVEFKLRKLTSATCLAVPGGFKFSGEGPGVSYAKTGYTISFSFTITGGETYFSATRSKGTETINMVSGEPLTKSTEVIH